MQTTIALAALGLIGSSCSNDRTAEDDVQVANHPARTRDETGLDQIPANLREPDLFGQWIVTGLQDQQQSYDLSPGPPIVLLFGMNRIDGTSQCIPYGFAYVRGPDSNQIKIGTHSAVGARFERVGPPPPQAVVCTRPLSSVEQAFPQVLQSVEKLAQASESAVTLIGSRGTITLSRPIAPELNPFGNVPQPKLGALFGEWRVTGVSNATLHPEENIGTVIGHSSIEMRSGCVSWLWLFNPQVAGLDLKEQSLGPICERGRSAAESALPGILKNRVSVARPSRDTARLTSDSGTVTLARVPDVRSEPGTK